MRIEVVMAARDELNRLLSEAPADAEKRAASAFDEVGSDRAIVLCGAGGLGKRIAGMLESIGRPAVAFVDNDPRRAGQSIGNTPIFSARDAIAKFSEAVFVVTIWRSPASETMGDRIEAMRALGAKHVTSFATLSWKHPEVFLPYYAIERPGPILEKPEDVIAGFERLADDESRALYVDHVRFRLHLDFPGKKGTELEYFAPEIVRLGPDTRFVDCGAFDGDTCRSFLAAVPDFAGRIHAFEPDRDSFARLAKWRDSLAPEIAERIDLTCAGVGARREKVSFAEGGGTGSSVGGAGPSVDIVPLDEAVADMNPTLIKVDVEGFEPEVIAGSRSIIQKTAPDLALCVYHRQDHPWSISKLVQDLRSDYRFRLRSYGKDGWDLCLYCTTSHS